MTLSKSGNSMTLAQPGPEENSFTSLATMGVLALIAMASLVGLVAGIAHHKLQVVGLSVAGLAMGVLQLGELLLETRCSTRFDLDAQSVTIRTSGWLGDGQCVVPFENVHCLRSEPGNISTRRAVIAVLETRDGTCHRLGHEVMWYEGRRWLGLGNRPSKNPVPEMVAEIRSATGLPGTDVASAQDRPFFSQTT